MTRVTASPRGFAWWMLWVPATATAFIEHQWLIGLCLAAFTALLWLHWHERWPVWASVKLRWQLRRLERGGAPVGFWSRREVMERDGQRCVFCKRKYRLRLVLVCPAQYGGSFKYDQVVTLCERCYLVKSDYYPGRVYHPRQGHNNVRQAAGIYAAMYNHIRACQKEDHA